MLLARSLARALALREGLRRLKLEEYLGPMDDLIDALSETCGDDEGADDDELQD